jgi:hypothetical protein
MSISGDWRLPPILRGPRQEHVKNPFQLGRSTVPLELSAFDLARQPVPLVIEILNG